ncbi:MAG: hypothetical protein FWH04_01640 [Oscillospiraceae bacterium]|nr:hypothetical protein [Oscillospiraceae bacterium]
MANYENMNLSEVQGLAKQGNKDALYEMVWRKPPDVQNDPVNSAAWQDIFLEKAADAGNIEAKNRYARSLLDRPMDAECRQKAKKYLEEILAAYDAGRIEDEFEGILAQFELGIILCEGYFDMQRDVAKGVRLLEAAQAKSNNFKEFGYRFHDKLGTLYATGLAQTGYNPSNADLDKAITYLDTATKRFKPEKNDPNNLGFLQLTKDMLNLQRQRRASHNPNITLSQSEIDEKRRKATEVSPEAQQQMNAIKAAISKLRQRLLREGWQILHE